MAVIVCRLGFRVGAGTSAEGKCFGFIVLKLENGPGAYVLTVLTSRLWLIIYSGRIEARSMAKTHLHPALHCAPQLMAEKRPHEHTRYSIVRDQFTAGRPQSSDIGYECDK